MQKNIRHIRIDAYDYNLPDERIAKFPLEKRDESKLLLYKQEEIEEGIFKHLPDYLPEGSILFFNNTRVIQARLLFKKATGAQVEIFCLEPISPRDYALIFTQTNSCVWSCMIGNLKKWKEGLLCKEIFIHGETIRLSAEKKQSFGDTHWIEFTWDNDTYTFADLLDAIGILPIPPYLHRETVENDLNTYQTVYSRIKGSVAAPTAGLHFTADVLADLDKRGFGREELTLHVGAGTFKPVKSETIEEHEMHTEFISVPKQVIQRIYENPQKVIAVGTTSVRTLESLYYIGVKLALSPNARSEELAVEQWEPYEKENNRLSTKEALEQILSYLERNQADALVTSTRIMIVPGYTFHIVKGIITNFHQPKSTLLLLISAFVKGDWTSIYDYALQNDFRFLSYGDSSLLL